MRLAVYRGANGRVRVRFESALLLRQSHEKDECPAYGEEITQVASDRPPVKIGSPGTLAGIEKNRGARGHRRDPLENRPSDLTA
jgi:hypothetical protein